MDCASKAISTKRETHRLPTELLHEAAFTRFNFFYERLSPSLDTVPWITPVIVSAATLMKLSYQDSWPNIRCLGNWESIWGGENQAREKKASHQISRGFNGCLHEHRNRNLTTTNPWERQDPIWQISWNKHFPFFVKCAANLWPYAKW